jgi:RHS repeat-associated protein
VSVPASGLPTSKAQIIDPLGSVVANITIPTSGNVAGPDSFQSFDEYGKPETPANPQSITQTGLQNFGWAGTANRQTETTGLILMGARVYNPVTGSFTSPDPIPGGNENTYAYPNDPINGNDFSGCWAPSDWIGIGGLVFGTLITAAACAASAGVACLVVGLVVGGVSGALESGAKAAEENLSPQATLKAMAFGALVGMATGSFGGKIGKAAKIAYRAYNAFHVAGATLRHAGLLEQVVGAVTGYGASKVLDSMTSRPVPLQQPKGKTYYWPKKV